mmetsp:Transcript_46580/g.97880  ORF Transcript_46580/g.97880 Transcript_46580/m.97880 type:complete len:147 (+) Transcript_46580:100-540(+)
MMLRSLFVLSTAATASAFLAPTTSRPTSCTAIQSAAASPHDAEAGVGSSWAGARFGDEFLFTGHYSASTTHGTTSRNAMDYAENRNTGRGHSYTASTTHERVDRTASAWTHHADAGNGAREWAGARFGDYGNISVRAAPTPSQWHE